MFHYQVMADKLVSQINAMKCLILTGSINLVFD